MPTDDPQPPAPMTAPVTDAMLRKAHGQNLANIIKQLADGKKLSKFEIEQLESATQAHPSDHRSMMQVMADELPGQIAREIATKDPEEERGKAIVELRAMMAAALSKRDLGLAFKIRKELNNLQGLKATGPDVFGDLLEVEPEPEE